MSKVASTIDIVSQNGICHYKLLLNTGYIMQWIKRGSSKGSKYSDNYYEYNDLNIYAEVYLLIPDSSKKMQNGCNTIK